MKMNKYLKRKCRTCEETKIKQHKETTKERENNSDM